MTSSAQAAIMDEARMALRFDEGSLEAASPSETGQGLGNVQSFVELTELRRLLSRLATAELLRMMVTDNFG